MKSSIDKLLNLFVFFVQKQQSHLQQVLEQTANQQKEHSQKSQQEIKQMSMKTQQDNNVVEQLKTIVAEKEAKVHRLEDEIQQLKLNVSIKGGNSSLWTVFHAPWINCFVK